jgi:hypothetical protein
MMLQVFLMIFAHTVCTMLLSWVYFDRYPIKRPPIGVFNLWDVGVMMGAILLIPYLYLALPRWAVAGLLGMASLGLVYLCFEPIWTRRGWLWLTALALTGGEVALLTCFGANSPPILAVNNLLQTIIVVGIANLLAQGGMNARDAAILAGTLTVYDYAFTALLPLMDDLFAQLEGLPFAPLVAWSTQDGQWGAMGLGDLLLATLFPLVMRRSHGKPAGLMASSLTAAAIAGVMLAFLIRPPQTSFPLMIVLGPLMVGQHLFWRWSRPWRRNKDSDIQIKIHDPCRDRTLRFRPRSILQGCYRNNDDVSCLANHLDHAIRSNLRLQ